MTDEAHDDVDLIDGKTPEEVRAYLTENLGDTVFTKEIVRRVLSFPAREAECQERREEIDLLETELAATKAALTSEEKQADEYARRAHSADKAVRALFEQLQAHCLADIEGLDPETRAAVLTSLARTEAKT